MVKSLTVNEFYPRWLVAREKGETINMIDVRSPDEYASAHVPDVKLIPLHLIPSRVDEISKTGDVYVICHSGGRSSQAIQFLQREFGYQNLINIEGGTQGWVKAGYPYEQGGI